MNTTLHKPLVFAIVFVITFFVVAPSASAHQSDCHKDHSCPSDTGSYVCGDLGNDSQCTEKKSDAKSAKVCTKDSKKLVKELAKIAKDSKKKNLSEKSRAKLETREKEVKAKVAKYEASCGALAAATLSITDTKVGSGAEAKSGATATVRYVGMLQDGTVFDASNNYSPHGFTFQLGVGKVIEGWDKGVVGMKVGGKRRLVIPPAQAYGSQSIGDIIPPNATLIFDIELIKVQ